MNRYFNALAIAYLLGLLLWLLGRTLWFDQFWLLALLNTHAFFLLLPLGLFLPYALWQKHWWLLAGFAIPSIFALHWFAPLFLPQAIAPVSPSSDATTLRLMSFNLLWDNEDYDAIAQAIQTDNPDVIGFQELRPEHLSALQTQLAPDYPYSIVHPTPDFHTVGVLSRFPLTEVQTLANPPIERGLQMQLQLPGRSLRLLITHLAPNNMFHFKPAEWIPLTRQRYSQRQAQVEVIQALVESSPAPVVMLCDCNMSDTSQTYEQLRRVLQDSFYEVGWGLGHTLLQRGSLPVQRVDFVWYRDPKAPIDKPSQSRLRSIKAEVGSAGASDHLPVFADLSLDP